VLANRKVKWAAPDTFGVTQRDIIDKLLSHQLDDLRETDDALESGELKLVPLSRRQEVAGLHGGDQAEC
jgi:hypothetical protein